jgi:hypothetical protein
MNSRNLVAVKSITSRFPAIFTLYQFLALIGDPNSRQGFRSVFRLRSILLIILGSIIWKADSFFDFRSRLRHLVEGRAVIRSTDISFHWVMYFLATHPKYQNAPRNVEIAAKVGKPGKKKDDGTSTSKVAKDGMPPKDVIEAQVAEQPASTEVTEESSKTDVEQTRDRSLEKDDQPKDGGEDAGTRRGGKRG